MPEVNDGWMMVESQDGGFCIPAPPSGGERASVESTPPYQTMTQVRNKALLRFICYKTLRMI